MFCSWCLLPISGLTLSQIGYLTTTFQCWDPKNLSFLPNLRNNASISWQGAAVSALLLPLPPPDAWLCWVTSSPTSPSSAFSTSSRLSPARSSPKLPLAPPLLSWRGFLPPLSPSSSATGSIFNSSVFYLPQKHRTRPPSLLPISSISPSAENSPTHALLTLCQNTSGGESNSNYQQLITNRAHFNTAGQRKKVQRVPVLLIE